MRKEAGFTLIELMVTLVVGAILMSMAVPSFRNFVLDTRLTNAANEFAASVNIARSEAAKRGVTIHVTSSGGGANWADGWFVWVDANGNNARDAGEELRRVQGLQNSLTMMSLGGTGDIQYRPSGRMNGNPDIIMLCDDRAGEVGRELALNNIGRLTVSRKQCS